MIEKIAILGDVHLGKNPGIGKNQVGVNSRLNDQIKLLDWVLNQCIENEVYHLVITGDVFEDPKPSINIIKEFVSFLKRCEYENLNVHIIVGNHDFVRIGENIISPLNIISEFNFESVFVYYDFTTIDLENLSITFMPFKDRRMLKTDINSEAIAKIENLVDYELSTIPNNNLKIVIGHFAIEGSIPIGDEIDDLSNELYLPLSLLKKYDYTWMGHIHKPQVLSNSNNIAHIGSMDISDFGETNHIKKLVIVSDKYKNNFKEIDIPCRKLEKLNYNISSEEDLETLKENIKSLDLKDKIIKIDINVDNDLKISKKEIEKLIASKEVYNIHSISEIRKPKQVKVKSSDIKFDISEMAAVKLYADKFVDENIRNDFNNLAEDIINKYKAK